MKATDSQLSLLSSETAIGFDELPSNRFLRVQLAVDDIPIEGVLTADGETCFPYKTYVFHVEQATQGECRHIRLYASAPSTVEWRIVAQLRIKTGGVDASVLKVVDQDVFEFAHFSKPIIVEVTNKAVVDVKFELRILNKLYLPLPSFDEGDIHVQFSDGTPIKTHRALLSLISKYMENFCSDDSIDSLDTGDFPKKAFLEMLYQIYPTRRPIYADFKNLTKAAVAYKVDTLIYSLSKRLVEFNSKPMSFEEKLRGALDLELIPAIEELVFRAAQDGVWTHMIRLGFEPEVFCGSQVYKKIICPTIIAARQQKFGSTNLISPYVHPDFFSPEAAKNKHNATIIFRGTPFHVNKGLLAVQGMEQFRIDEGCYVAMFSRHMELHCALGNLLPGEVLESLLCSFYPLGPSVEHRFLRAAIVFCHDHGWNIVKENLEQLLLSEPPKSTTEYLQQIRFAEACGLDNMLSVAIQRAEGSCNTEATSLTSLPDFALISQKTRDAIMDRLCSGWGLEPKHTSRLATRNPTSFCEREISITHGGPRGIQNVQEDATLAEVLSADYFGTEEQMLHVA